MGLKFLPKRLKEAREKLGYSPKDLEKLTGIDAPTIQEFEQGKCPTNDQILRLSRILGQPLWHFFGFDDG